MAKKSKTKKAADGTIIINRKAKHDYFLETYIEAGLALQGWEVKSLRAGRVSLTESYVILRAGEAYLLGCHITPLESASTHFTIEPDRTRKLLLHRKEINQLIGSVERKGYSVVPVSLYWKKNRVKANIALAKGKKQHDKRASEKEHDWQREKARAIKGEY